MLFCQRSVFTELAIVFSDSFILIYLKYKLESKSNWGLAIFGLEPAFLHFIRNSWIAVHHLACLSLGWHSLRHVRGACQCVVNCVSLDLHWLSIDWYGCFRKWWYPQIIHFDRVFHYKPSILGYPYFGNTHIDWYLIVLSRRQQRWNRLLGQLSFLPGPWMQREPAWIWWHCVESRRSSDISHKHC